MVSSYSINKFINGYEKTSFTIITWTNLNEFILFVHILWYQMVLYFMQFNLCGYNVITHFIIIQVNVWTFITLRTDTLEHEKFNTWNLWELEVPGIFTICNFHNVKIYTLKGSCQFYLLENCLSGCEVVMVLNFGQLKAHLFIPDKNQWTHYMS